MKRHTYEKIQECIKKMGRCVSFFSLEQCDLCVNVCVFHKDDTMKVNDIRVLIPINENYDSFFFFHLFFIMVRGEKKEKKIVFLRKAMKRLCGRKA